MIATQIMLVGLVQVIGNFVVDTLLAVGLLFACFVIVLVLIRIIDELFSIFSTPVLSWYKVISKHSIAIKRVEYLNGDNYHIKVFFRFDGEDLSHEFDLKTADVYFRLYAPYVGFKTPFIKMLDDLQKRYPKGVPKRKIKKLFLRLVQYEMYKRLEQNNSHDYEQNIKRACS